MNFLRRYFPTFSRWFGAVQARLESAYQQWGVRRWLQTTYQDARFEIDFAAVRETCRKHLDLVENTPIIQKIRNLKLQFAVGVSGLRVIPNASDPALKLAQKRHAAARAEVRGFWGVADYDGRKEDYRKALKNLIAAKKAEGMLADELEDWNESRASGWEAWAKAPELGSNLSFGELTIQWEGMLFDVGNVLVQKTRDEQGQPRIQTIDFLRLQTPPNMAAEEGKTIIQGIKLTKIRVPVRIDGKVTTREVITGKPASYFIRDEFDLNAFAEIPASEIIHKFRALRPGMMVGLPEAFSVINKVIDYTDLHILEMSASKLAGKIANVHKTPSGEFDTLTSRRAGMKLQTQPAAGAALTNKNYGEFYEVTVGAEDYALPIGSDLKNFIIERPTIAQQDYWQHIISEICAGYNVPKLLVFPFSLQGTVTRADLDVCANAFRADFELIASIAREVYEWQTGWSVKYDLALGGKVPANPLGCVIRPPRAPNVDIGYTAKALQTELQMGIKTIQDVYADKNEDWRLQLRQVAEAVAFINDLAAEFHCQPSQISSLMAQQAAAAGKGDPPEGGGDAGNPSPEARAADVFAFVPVVRGNNSLRVSAAGETHVIELIGTVGQSYWDDSGITEKEFRDVLKGIPVGQPIVLKINSEGGSVQEGLGIYNAIKERREDITVRITGYALSIASVFPLGAGKVISPKSAIWMMHMTWCGAQGNAEDMRQTAEMLDTHDETLVDIYAAETGKSKADIRAAMEKETWIKGGDAVEFGLADEGDEDEAQDNGQSSIANRQEYRPLAQKFLDRCKSMPAAILNCIQGTTISAVQNGGQPNTQNQEQMNKKTLVALLLRHGIQASETETVEQLQAKLDGIPVAAAPAAPAAPAAAAASAAQPAAGTATPPANADIIDIRAQLAAQNRKRLEDKVAGYVDLQKITKAEIPIFVAAALADEAGTFTILDDKPVAEVGGEPVGFNRIEGGGRPVLAGYEGQPTEMVVNLYKAHTTPAARYEALKAEFPAILNDAYSKGRKLGVRNENTFAAGITTNFLIIGAITQLGPQVAALKAFSRDNSVDPFKPLAIGVQKFNTTVQDGSDTLTNATDFSTGGDSTLNGPTIAVAQYTQTMHLTNAQLNSGVRFADLIEAKLGSLRSKIAQVVTAPITVANFGTVAGVTGADLPLVSAPDAFGFGDLASLQGSLKKSNIKNVVLDGEYLARIANSPGFFQAAGVVGGMEGAWKAFGWDLIALLTEWSGAGANIRGIACNPQAIGIIAGLPLNPLEGIPGNIVQVGVAQLAGPGIAIATYLWMDANARTMRASYDLMLGASAVDKTAARLIKSA